MGTRHATAFDPTGGRADALLGEHPTKNVGRAKANRKARRPAAQPEPKTDVGGGYSREQLARDLRLVRERRGLSQQAVAKALGLPRSAVTNIENGRRRVDTIELGKLADIYGCTIRALFHPKAEAHMVDLAVELHRALPGLRHAKAVESEIMRVIGACRDGTGYRNVLGRTGIPAVPAHPSKAANASDAIRQGEAAAHEERRRLGLGPTPIANIAGLLNNEGVWCATAKLPDDLSGLFFCHPTVGLAILVNRGHAPKRRNFSCAHEYAHAIFDREDTVTATRRDGVSDLRELRANAFAAAFLMPRDGVSDRLGRLGKGLPSRREFAGYDVGGDAGFDAEVRPRPGSQTVTFHDVATLAHHFYVSQEVMTWRLQNLGHIGPKEKAALIAGANLGKDYADLLDSRKPGDSDPGQDGGGLEFRLQVMHLAYEAFRLEKISGGRLRKTAWNLSLDEFPLSNLAAWMIDDG